MSTGIETWKNLSEIGPIYPFVGAETFLVIVGLVFWIGWHVLQIHAEREHHEKAIKEFRKRNGG